ncbi:hypothetical protein ACLOJK_002023 [Asimina triloba]
MKSPDKDDQLQQQFQHLQQDWNSFKRSNPHRPLRRPSGGLICAGSNDLFQLMDSSPRGLISSLQKDHSPFDGWRIRTNDLAVQEITRDRQDAIESGRLKGRRLFDGGDELGMHGKAEMCSGSTSVLIQGADVEEHYICSCSCSSSSFDDDCSWCQYKGSVEGGGEVRVEEVKSNVAEDVRWMVRMSWIGLVLVVFALGVISWKGNEGGQGRIYESLIPT